MAYKIWLGMVMLVACGAAFEMYDENNPMAYDQNEDYSDDNYNYLDPVPYGPETLEDPARNLMLYQLFNSLQNRDDVHLQMHYRPEFGIIRGLSLTNYAPAPFTDLLGLKNAIVKRPSDAPSGARANTNVHKNKPGIRQQPKWKGKVRKVGSQMVCYFKLCAFRPPV